MKKYIGRYKISKELGRGGMATVYLARDPAFDRDVAIKLLPQSLLHDSTFHARFVREARTVAALEHSAIVPVYDYGEDYRQPYIVMRYMSGGSLRQKAFKKKMPTEAILEILNRIAPALDFAHRKGIVHRDLKPENILFDGQGDAFITDFGIARLRGGNASLTGRDIVGTPAYMSPEQATGEGEIDGRSDQYAIGIVLFELLSGKLPFSAATPIRMALARLTETPLSILAVRNDLPSEVNEVFSTVFQKNASRRFSSVRELASSLHQALKAELGTEIFLPSQGSYQSGDRIKGSNRVVPPTKKLNLQSLVVVGKLKEKQSRIEENKQRHPLSKSKSWLIVVLTLIIFGSFILLMPLTPQNQAGVSFSQTLPPFLSQQATSPLNPATTIISTGIVKFPSAEDLPVATQPPTPTNTSTPTPSFNWIGEWNVIVTDGASTYTGVMTFSVTGNTISGTTSLNPGALPYTFNGTISASLQNAGGTFSGTGSGDWDAQIKSGNLNQFIGNLDAGIWEFCGARSGSSLPDPCLWP
ncbi:MAG: serine/threonine-protein kinase [Anaerolineales bacterium]